jgi:hypothetical protein
VKQVSEEELLMKKVNKKKQVESIVEEKLSRFAEELKQHEKKSNFLSVKNLF